MNTTKEINKTVNEILKLAYGCCEKKPTLIGHKALEAHDKIIEILKHLNPLEPITSSGIIKEEPTKEVTVSKGQTAEEFIKEKYGIDQDSNMVSWRQYIELMEEYANSKQKTPSKDLTALLESLGDISNEYKVYYHSNEWWLEHKEVGSGELLKDWLLTHINK